jgi:hypothetical protein
MKEKIVTYISQNIAKEMHICQEKCGIKKTDDTHSLELTYTRFMGPMVEYIKTKVFPLFSC